MKTTPKLAIVLLLASVAAVAQQSRTYRDDSGWVEEISGSLAGVHSLRVSAQMGSVEVKGGSQQAVNYVVRLRAFTSSEQEARRKFAQYHVDAAARGDLAVIEGQYQG
ncbi:MAG TPA: hypothetical protein VKB60_02510, partial [Terriglobales bacterium]|nr:hypothetical protein [Terriglobales bacterium]